jgi:hypothetical protein
MSSYFGVITERQMQQVRDLYAAFGRMPIAAFVQQFAASDVELKPVPDWAVLSSGEEVWRGQDAVIRSLEELESVVGQLSAELLELMDVGDAALAAIQLRGAGRGSGAGVELPVWHLIELGSDDLITRMRSFPSAADAHDAVGPREPRPAESSPGRQPPA